MADEKEQLRIEAELDTSNLKNDAKTGFNEVVKEEKKIEEQSKSTSKAIDNIGESGKKVGNEIEKSSTKSMQSLQGVADKGKEVGRSLSDTGKQAETSLKSISKEATNAEKSLDNLEKSTKQIRLQQAIGVLNKGISTLAPVGKALASEIGMSDDAVSFTGNLVSGAMGGAMIGASIGGPFAPITTAGGALIGAATSLIGAASELKKSAIELRQNAENRYKELSKNQDEIKKSKEWDSHIADLEKGLTTTDEKTVESTRQKITREIRNLGIESTATQTVIDETRRETDKKAREIETTYSGREKENKLTVLYADAASTIDEAVRTQNENALKSNSLATLLSRYPVKQENIKTASNEAVKTEKETKEARPSRIANVKSPEEIERQNQIASINSSISEVGKMQNFKLSDSLTRVGGGTGYATQMNGVANHVSKISETLNKMLTELKKFNEDTSTTEEQTTF